MRRSWPVLLLGVVVLSGCSGAGGDQGTEVGLGDGSSVNLEDFDNAAGKGSISGVVVDEAVRPLVGVALSLGGRNQTTETDDGGVFTFRDLEPGLYTLIAGAHKLPEKNFLATQTTAEVVAGETAKVRIVLPIDPTPVPFHGATMKFDGFYQFSSGFVDEVLDLAVWNQTVGTPAGNVSTPPSPACQCHFYFAAEAVPTTIVAELIWPESNPVPSFWTMDLNNELGESTDLLFCEANPCLMHAQAAGNFTEAARAYDIGVWTDPTWVYVNVSFQLFVTVFYGAEAPDGWSFTDGDT